jgi:hypothetical protein
VLTADAELDVRTRIASLDAGALDQLADAIRVERLERVLLEDVVPDVVGQE